MPQLTTRLMTLCATALALAACTVPGVGYVGGGPLPFDALAVTRPDPVTGNLAYTVNLKWSKAPGAATYQVLRKFGDQPFTEVNSSSGESYTDSSLTAKQTASYRVRAVKSDNTEVTVSADKTITLLEQTVAKPVLKTPADNAVVGVSELPKFSWDAAPNATWYFVRVIRLSDSATSYSALTKETSISFADKSPLAFEKFGDVFPVGNPNGIAKGVVHSWTVQAVRAVGTTDPATATAVDVNTSAAMKFSQVQ